MKTFSKILLLGIFSATAFVACGKKSDGGNSTPVANCTIGQVLPQGQYCNGGQIVPAQICNSMQAAPVGYVCMNGYLIPTGYNGGGNLLNGVQFRNSYMQGSLGISGTSAMGWTDPNAISMYSGTVTLTGTLVVGEGLYCGIGMMVPPGSYSISGQGLLSSNSLYSTQLMISGPSQMQLMIGYGVLNDPSTGFLTANSSTTRLGIMNSNLVVSGAYCGAITSY